MKGKIPTSMPVSLMYVPDVLLLTLCIINIHKFIKALLCLLFASKVSSLLCTLYVCIVFLDQILPLYTHKITIFVVAGLQVFKSLHSHTGSHAEHSRRSVEDGVGVQEQGDGAAVCLL